MITRYQETQTEVEKKRKILQALHKELKKNLVYKGNLSMIFSMNNGNKSQETYKTDFDIPEDDVLIIATNISTSLSTIYWNTFSDGGELEWIKDPELLQKIASGYEAINFARRVAGRYYDLLNIFRFDPHEYARSYLKGQLLTIDTLLEDQIKKSLQHIEEVQIMFG